MLGANKLFRKATGESNILGFIIIISLLLLIICPTLILADSYLKVNIQPFNARALGAKWRYQEMLYPGWSDWFSSGYNVGDVLEPGNPHEIEFSEIRGYVKPDNIIFTAEFDMNEFTGTYLHGGQIVFWLNPFDVRDAGARWRRVGTGTWLSSGHPDIGLPTGWYEIEFKPVEGYVTPENMRVQAVIGEIKDFTATYGRADGKLTVNINPGAARDAGAMWRWGSSTTWLEPGHTESLQPFMYRIFFKPVRGWVAPEPKIVEVPQSGEKTVTYSYSRLDVGKIRIIADECTLTGNNFTAGGNVHFAINTAASAPGGNPAGYTSDFVHVTGNVSGTLAPARIKGNGEFTLSGVDLPVIGSLPLYKGPYTINADNLKVTDVKFLPVWKYLGFDLEIYYWQLFVKPAGVGFGLRLDLPEAIYGPNSYIDIPKFEVKTTGISVIGEINITDFSLFEGFFTLKGMHGSIDTTTGSFSFIVDELSIYELPTFSASLIIENKQLREISGGAYDMGFQIPDTPIYFQDLALCLRDPGMKTTSVSLDTIAFTCFDRVGGWSLLEFAGNATVDFTGHLGIGAYITALGYDFAHATFDLWWNIGLTTSVRWTEPKFLLTADGKLTIWWFYKPHYWYLWLQGMIGFDLPDWMIETVKFFKPSFDETSLYLTKGSIAVADDGFTCSTSILGMFDVSFHIPPFWKSAPPQEVSVRGLQTASITRASPTKSESFKVSQFCPAVIASVKGQSGLPEVLLTLPDGSTFDSRGSLPENGNDFVFVQNSEKNITSFFFREPMAGKWKVAVKNSGEIGSATVYFVGGNCAPNVIPKKIEQIGNNSYKLIANAYDPDETAKVTFYWNKDNESFTGSVIGEVDENDGRLEYVWTPSADTPFKTGYVFAEIKDGSNQMRRVYFKEKLNIGQTLIRAPRFGKCKVVKDTVRFRSTIRNASGVDHLKVYFSDDLELENLTDSINIRAERKVVLDENQLKPGRRYQIRLASLGYDGSESPQSKKRVFDYHAKKINNHPYFISEPVLETAAGSEYVYEFKARDYDSDVLAYTLKEAPAGMILDPGGSKLRWMPTADNAGQNYVALQVSDGKGGEDRQEFTVMVESAAVPVQTATMEVVNTRDGRLLIVRVADHLAGGDPSAREMLQVSMRDKWDQYDTEIALLETAANSNLFQGTLRLDDPAAAAPIWLIVDRDENGSIETIVTWENRQGKARKARTTVIGK